MLIRCSILQMGLLETMKKCERYFILMIGLVLGLGGCFALGDELFLRGDPGSRVGVTLQVNDSGVYFRRGAAAGVWYSWDRVRDLQTENIEFAKSLKDHQEFAEEIWRARQRVEREDYVRAEPIFEAWFGGIMGRTDPSALVVAEGLLRCRLARASGGGLVGGSGGGGGREGAVLPWLETWRMKQAGVETPAYGMMKPVMDANSGLCPALSPVWIEGPALSAMVTELGVYVPVDAPVVEAVSRLYLESAERVLHRSPGSFFDEMTDEMNGSGSVRDAVAHSASVMFVKAFTDAVSPTTSVEVRSAAIRRLSARVSDSGWRGAWAHYARGRAYLLSDDEDDHQRGLVDLLYLPSEYVEVDWYLSGMALAESWRYLQEHGEVQAAGALHDDLMKRFANHPVLREDVTASAGGR